MAFPPEESWAGGKGSDAGTAAVCKGSSAGVTGGEKIRSGDTGSDAGSAAGGAGGEGSGSGTKVRT